VLVATKTITCGSLPSAIIGFLANRQQIFCAFFYNRQSKSRRSQSSKNMILGLNSQPYLHHISNPSLQAAPHNQIQSTSCQPTYASFEPRSKNQKNNGVLNADFAADFLTKLVLLADVSAWDEAHQLHHK
jgi:hypothetical protein